MSARTLSTVASRLPAPSRRVRLAVGAVAVAAQILIAVSGSVVRVTGSGLGCPTWPHCAASSFVPISHPELGQFHQWVEFGNRMLAGAVTVVAVVCLITALLARPYRRRYLWLAASMPIGVLAEAVIGGITVRAHLLWWTVAIHFLVSPVLVWFAVLFFRAANEGDERPRALIPRGLLVVASGLLALVLVAGTLVTAAGPHGGDAGTPRLQLPIPDLAATHGGLLGLFLATLAVIGVFIARYRGGVGATTLRRRYTVLIATVLAQGVIGVVQYFEGVPDFMIPLHVFGATLVIGGMASLWCAARYRGAVVATAPRPRPAAATAAN